MTNGIFAPCTLSNSCHLYDRINMLKAVNNRAPPNSRKFASFIDAITSLRSILNNINAIKPILTLYFVNNNILRLSMLYNSYFLNQKDVKAIHASSTPLSSPVLILNQHRHHETGLLIITKRFNSDIFYFFI